MRVQLFYIFLNDIKVRRYKTEQFVYQVRGKIPTSIKYNIRHISPEHDGDGL